MSSTLRAGLVIGVATLLIGLPAGLMCQVCIPILALASGALAGFLSQKWGEPATAPAAQSGAIAGGVAGLGALLGQTASAIINGVLVGSGTIPNPMEEYFGPVNENSLLVGVMIWVCVGVAGAAMAAGTGALAAHLSQKKQTAPAE
ncbi:MAG: hypothetical protein JXB07_17955 [Anaerolineae bacterium]|nr:hypothetical protein [Anaerolineae bacterium]